MARCRALLGQHLTVTGFGGSLTWNRLLTNEARSSFGLSMAVFHCALTSSATMRRQYYVCG